MPTLKMNWTDLANKQFEEMRKRAVTTNQLAEFSADHDELVAIFRDLDRTIEKSEHWTDGPDDVVRYVFQKFFTVKFRLCLGDQVGWVLKYDPDAARLPPLKNN